MGLGRMLSPVVQASVKLRYIVKRNAAGAVQYREADITDLTGTKTKLGQGFNFIKFGGIGTTGTAKCDGVTFTPAVTMTLECNELTVVGGMELEGVSINDLTTVAI